MHGYFLAFGCHELLQSEKIPMSSLLSIPEMSTALPALFFLLLPHILYYYIWNWPKSYSKLVAKVSKQHPVDFMLTLVKIGKVIQFSSFLIWYSNAIETSFGTRIIEIFTLKSLTIVQFICGIYLMVIGQFINTYVWKKLGVDGACYGFKLGRPIEWVTGFPFNLGLRHPQYVATFLTICGVTFLLIDKASAENGIVVFVLIWNSYNIFTGWSEQISDQDLKKKA